MQIIPNKLKFFMMSKTLFAKSLKTLKIPWVAGIHQNPKVNLVWQCLFLKTLNFVKKQWLIGNGKVLFYLIPFSQMYL